MRTLFALLVMTTPVLAQTSHVPHATLLNVHVLADGSLGEIQVLNSNGEDALAICVARRNSASRAKFRGQKPVQDHWEKQSILIDHAGGPVTCN